MCPHACLLLGTRQRKQIETAQGTIQFPTTIRVHALAHDEHRLATVALVLLPTRVKAAIAKDSAQWGWEEPAWAWHCI